jgi:sugar phosphate isomerase/epimerase
MKLGFMSACFPELSLEELVEWASGEGFGMLELAVWPQGQKERRYAGTSHIDVANLDSEKASEIKALFEQHKMQISSLGYYPNYLDPNLEVRERSLAHIKDVIKAAGMLGVGVVGTFVGRDPKVGVQETLVDFRKIFDPLCRFAADNNVKIAIENCPMLYPDTWPGGTNVATSPAIWRQMFEMVPADNLGLNLDPSHLLWQWIDAAKCVYEFKDKLFHIHAKDAIVDYEKLHQTGVFGLGWRVDKLAGMGNVDFKKYIDALYAVGYDYVVSIEHEDRAFEGTTDKVKRGLLLSKQLLQQYVV